MRQHDYVPGADAQFNEWADNVVNMSMGQGELWGYPEAAFTAVRALHDKFKEKYTNANLPSSRTSAAVKTKNEARAAFEKALRVFLKAYVTYNPAVDTEYRVRMGLPVHRSTRERVPVPASVPKVQVDSSTIRRLKFHYEDSEVGGKAKPAGVHGCEVKWAIAEGKPSLRQLANTAFDTHTPFVMEFDDEERGKTVWFAARWENTRGEKGPFGEVQSAIVP